MSIGYRIGEDFIRSRLDGRTSILEVNVDRPISVEVRPLSICIESIRVDRQKRYGHDSLNVTIDSVVIDVASGQPLRARFSEEYPFFSDDPTQKMTLTIARAVESALLRVLSHEVRETLFVHGTHLHEPHPEQRRGGEAPVLPLLKLDE